MSNYTIMLSISLRSFLCSSSIHFCHIFIISSASVRSIQFLFCTASIFSCNTPLKFLTFLKQYLVFPIPLFSHSTISLHCSFKNTLLSLLAIIWKSALRWIYLSYYPLPLASLLFSAICKTSDSHFAFLHFFFLGMV